MDLELLLTSPEGFGLTTATPVQRAICRASTGVPLGELAEDPDVQQVFGGRGALDSLPRSPPNLFPLIAATRSAKSRIAAAAAFRASQVCDLSRTDPGDGVRISLVSLKKDQAHAVWDHLLAGLYSSPTLAQAVAKWPAGDSLQLWHPSGRTVEVKVVAGARAGGTLVARWAAGLVFDEAPRMLGQEDGIINLDDALTSVRSRVLPGCQIWLPGSPWAPRGPVYQMYVDSFGKPSANCVVAKATGPMMNPYWFTPEFCEQLRINDPRAYKTDVLAEFADPEDALLSSVDVQACTRERPEQLEPEPRNNYSAAIDPATRGNGWTLTIVTSDSPNMYRVAVARQWKGSHSRPLKPREVLREIAAVCKLYRIDTLATDQWSIDAMRELAGDVGLDLREVNLNAELWRTMAENLRVMVAEHRLELPPNPTLRSDLLGIQRRLTAQSWTPALASTAGDNRHSDYVPSLCLSLLFPPSPPAVEEPPEWADEDERRVCEMLQQRAANPLGEAFRRWA